MRKFVVSTMEFLYVQQAYPNRERALESLKERPILWKRDRLAFVLGDSIAYAQITDVSRREQYRPPYGVKSVIVNMTNGTMQIDRKMIGELDPGDAVVVSQNTRGWRADWKQDRQDDDVTIHIRAWSSDDRVVDELSTIRDMVLSGETQDAQRLAKELLPFGWHMFTTLCLRERTWIETKGFG